MQNSKCKIKISEIERQHQVFFRQHLVLNRFRKFFIILIAFGLILPSFSLAQEELGTAAPKTIEEAKSFITAVLSKLPEAVKRIWQEEALPLWQKMWEWAKPFIEPWWNKFLSLFNKEVEKRKPALQQEFQKEKEEIEQDLWKRFKDLLK